MRPGGSRTYSEASLPLQKWTARRVRLKWITDGEDSCQELKMLIIIKNTCIRSIKRYNGRIRRLKLVGKKGLTKKKAEVKVILSDRGLIK